MWQVILTFCLILQAVHHDQHIKVIRIMILYIILIAIPELRHFIYKTIMDTATGLIQVNTQQSIEIKPSQSPSLIIDNTQEKPTQESSLEIVEIQKSNDFLEEASRKKPEESSQSSSLDPVSVMDVPGEQKKELAYQVTEIKEAFESKDINLDTVIDRVKDIMDNAYKMSPKDTPYDDYETRLKAIQTWAKLLQIGKPQSVYNVLNMRGKPPQIN